MAQPDGNSRGHQLPKVTDSAALVRGLKLLYSDVRDFQAEKVPANAGFLWKLVHLDPALWKGIVLAIVAIAAGFGFVLSDLQVEAITAGVIALMSLVQALWTRGSVTANSKVVVYKPDPVSAPAIVAPGDAVSSDAVAVVNAAASTPTLDLPLLPGGTSA